LNNLAERTAEGSSVVGVLLTGRSFMLEETLARGWSNLVGRWNGPMSFRILMQPAIAIFFAVRAGWRDARRGKPSILCDLFSDPITRQERLRQVWKDVGTVFLVALVLDSIYQVIVQGGIFALELLFTATVLALVPYVVSRGLVTMIAKRTGVGKQCVSATQVQDSESN